MTLAEAATQFGNDVRAISYVPSFRDVGFVDIAEYDRVLVDRDGVLANHGELIGQQEVDHFNQLQGVCGSLVVATNGNGSIDGLHADSVRARFPMFKQVPGVLRSMVEIPEHSAVITDSHTEAAAAIFAHFGGVIMVTDGFRPHWSETMWRATGERALIPLIRSLIS